MKHSHRWLDLVVIVGLIAVAPFLTGVGKGKTTEFTDTKGLAPVPFSGTVHAEKGLKCTDCHTKVFKMKRGATPKEDLSMKAMKEGKSCGSCHNGEKAFSVAGDCAKCHVKK
ncbi:MAG: cytochrome c3 family protein [Candidatus Tectimicrobiota bacterium]